MGEHEQTATGIWPTIGQKLAEARKAIAAAVTAGVGGAFTAAVAAVQEKSAGGTTITGDEWHGIALAGFGVALTAGYAAWQAANRPNPDEQTTAGYPDGLKSEPDDALG
ncbi:hypothetical protein [Curtobacterium sp. VKM Ac-1376]|uniref:hypothetical protein n=1 Tax=Curtobacterium sp. VKM Ac-1376 TaxID=123312 RepID=UPI00188CA33E|nr:hypothetical protein [Curtobacterium sp. VKM Ac-1376]MBF4613280.1 hypothetical protein [Curtobacterium sp. VKM Ac-1376]